MIIYTVKSGDKLRSIAKKFDCDSAKIREINSLLGDSLVAGAALAIPTRHEAHCVALGDSLYSISALYGSTLEEIINLNPHLKPSYSPAPGEYVIIPPQPKLKKMTVSGRFGTIVRTEAIKCWAPALTYASFGCVISPEGNFAVSGLGEHLAYLKSRNVAPICRLENRDRKGGFSGEIIEALLNNPAAVDNLIKTAPDYLKRLGFMGLQLDFRGFDKKFAPEIGELCEQLSARIASEGLLFGSDYKAYRKFDEALYPPCDAAYCELLVEEWENEWAPPGAISPIIPAERTLRSVAESLAPRATLLLLKTGGCDSALPRREGSVARILSAIASLNLAKSTHSAVEYNTTSETPYFTYRDAGARDHIVWFNDLRSLAARIHLAAAYNLEGISLSSLNAAWQAAAYTITQTVEVKKLI